MVPQATTRLAFLVIAATACGARPAAPDPPPPLSHEVVELSLPSVEGVDIDLARWRGKPMAIHFASTGSLDAQADVEELRRTRTEVPDLVLVEVVVDELGARVAAPWADASRIDWSVLLPSAELLAGGTAFGRVRVVPTTFLLDREGRVSWRWEGALRRGMLQRNLAP